MAVARFGFLLAFVCLFIRMTSQKLTQPARITKLDSQIFHTESWKCIYFGVKRSRWRVTETVSAWVVALLWLLASTSSVNDEPLKLLN